MKKILIIIAYFFLCTFLLSANANGLGKKTDIAQEAINCKYRDKCPYFSDLYNKNSEFKDIFNKELKLVGIETQYLEPDHWLSEPAMPVIIDSKKLLYISICEPHNCGHSIELLYDPNDKYILGRYFPDETEEENKDIQPTFFGKDNNVAKKILFNIDMINISNDKNLKLPINLDNLGAEYDIENRKNIAPITDSIKSGNNKEKQSIQILNNLKNEKAVEQKNNTINKNTNNKFNFQLIITEIQNNWLIIYNIFIIILVVISGVLVHFFLQKQYYGRIIGRKSWLVYFKSLLKYTILYSMIYYIHLEQKYGSIGEDINFILYYLLVIFFLNNFFENRSYYISIFDSEVRINSGYLPWSINCEFIYWKDIVNTMYYVNFMSWLTNSYTIVISRKNNNTYDSEINMTNIWNAKKVSGTIIYEYESRLKSTERYQVY